MPKISISSLVLAIALTACASFSTPFAVAKPTADPLLASCDDAVTLQDQLSEHREASEAELDMPASRALVGALTACLGSSDPHLRDAVGYTGLTQLLRNEQVSDALKREMQVQLLLNMSPDLPDPDGVLKPFSILVLAELIRADRVTPYMGDEERMDALDAGIGYLYRLNDYRDYDDTEGWRHGVAHTADLMMQAVLNPAYGREAHLMIVETAFMKARALNHGYTAGEGERLARPVLFAARAGLITDEEWDELFAGLTDHSPMLEWSDAYKSRGGLNRLHNIKALLYPIYATAAQSEPGPIADLKPRALGALRKLP